jgi:hypothetical protein
MHDTRAPLNGGTALASTGAAMHWEKTPQADGGMGGVLRAKGFRQSRANVHPQS